MVTKVDSTKGIAAEGKHYYSMWQNVFEIDTKYVPVKPIGKGAYGIVCSAHNTETDEKVAIKKITNAFENRTDAQRTLREIRLLRQLRHDNIISIKDIMRPIGRLTFNDVYLVCELMDTDLHKIIRSSQPLTDDHCQYFIYQLLRGLKYLHSANVMHRDLKPSNILLNSSCDLKICDFGLARTVTEKGQFMTEYVVTRWYRAPELLLSCDDYDRSVDMWSVGCIFAELLGRKPIFPGKDYINQLKLIISILGNPDEGDLGFIQSQKAYSYIKSLPATPRTSLEHVYSHANAAAINLLDRMLTFDPRKRITVTEALEHPYFSGLHDSNLEPSAAAPFDLYLEDEDLTEEALREMIWNEMLYYHPEAANLT